MTFHFKIEAKLTAMEVHPEGSPLSSLDSGRPGESCGCRLSCEPAFYDITNLFALRIFAVEIFKKRGSDSQNVSWHSLEKEVHLWLYPKWINWRHCELRRSSWRRAKFQQSVYAQVSAPAFNSYIFADVSSASSYLAKCKFARYELAKLALLGGGGNACSE